MDDLIRSLGATLLIGVFTLLGVEAVCYFVAGKKLTGFFEHRLGFSSNTVTAVVLAISFSIGLVGEDVSLRLVDDRALPITAPFNYLSRLLPVAAQCNLDIHPLPQRLDLRLAQLAERTDGQGRSVCELIEEDRASGARHPHDVGDATIGELRPTGLARELAATESFLVAMPQDLREAIEAQKWFGGEPNQVTDVLQINRAARAMYYLAKNRVFAQDTYFSELTHLQTRLDFSRSLSLIAALFSVVALPFGLIVFTRRSIQRWRIDLAVKRNTALRHIKPNKNERLKRAAITPRASLRRRVQARRAIAAGAVFTVVYGLVYLAGVWAYHRETDEFNKRAFGYYSGVRLTCKANDLASGHSTVTSCDAR